jgi:hypothetical protein
MLEEGQRRAFLDALWIDGSRRAFFPYQDEHLSLCKLIADGCMQLADLSMATTSQQ